MHRFLVLVHRYLGIPMSVLFCAWFGSGIVMMYTRGMPAMTPQQQRQAVQPPDLASLPLAPSEALPDLRSLVEIEILTLLERPAYRYRTADGAVGLVYADSGEKFPGVSIRDGRAIASRFIAVPEDRIEFDSELETPDQWTLTEQHHLPILRYRVADEAGSVVYVSKRDANVVLITDRRSRFLAWIGAIPHWLYVTPLRSDQPLWYWTVVVLSVAGCLLALLGLALAVTAFRFSRPFRLEGSVLYRGLMRWHYFAGAIFGLFVFTWVWSGLMSMEPFEWQKRPRLVVDASVLAGAPLSAADCDVAVARDWRSALPSTTAHTVRCRNILGNPYLLVESAAGEITAFHARSGQPQATPFTDDDIAAQLELVTGAAVTNVISVTGYDAWYYDRDGRRPLPVLRVDLGDADQSRIYVDTRTASIVTVTNRYTRIQRWLFNGLHSLDFPGWYDRRPAWDAVMITLSAGGLLLSLTGLVAGWRRTGRAFRRRIAVRQAPGRDKASENSLR